MIDWGGGLGRESWGGGVRGVEVGGVGVDGVGVGRLGSGIWGQGVEVGESGLGGFQFSPAPLTPTLPTQLQPITVVWPIFRIGTVANVCPTLNYAQILGHIRMSHPLCDESSVANLPCGESSGNPSILILRP